MIEFSKEGPGGYWRCNKYQLVAFLIPSRAGALELFIRQQACCLSSPFPGGALDVCNTSLLPF
jgi:hypothetical protein